MLPNMGVTGRTVPFGPIVDADVFAMEAIKKWNRTPRRIGNRPVPQGKVAPESITGKMKSERHQQSAKLKIGHKNN